MTYVIYGDLFFLFNFFFDSLMLYGTAKLSCTDFRIWRLVLAGFVGGIYGILSVLPRFSFLGNQLVVLIFPALLLVMAFGRLPKEKALRLLCYYYLLAFAVNGIGMAGKNLLHNCGLGGEIVPIVFLPVILIIILVRAGIVYFKKIIAEDGCLIHGLIEFAAGQAELNVFLDTGNNLKDPVSGCPVMVVEYEAVCRILPKELCEEYAKCKSEQKDILWLYDSIGAKYADTDWFGRLSLVSFRSVGKKQGFLLGFRPDKFCVKNNDCSVVVALYDGRLGGRQNFNAIVSPWILENKKIKSLKKGDVCG